MNYDVIIIGSGMAGLTCSLRLAKSGKKVALFEKHYIPGGYATNFSRKGKDGNVYNFDCSLHSLGGVNKDCSVYNLLHNLNITDKVEFVLDNHAAISRDNKFYPIPHGIEEFKKWLYERHPNHNEGIDKLFDVIKNVYSDVIKLTKDTSLVPKNILGLENILLEDFIRQYVDNDDFIQDFSYIWGYDGLPPSKLNTLYYLATVSSYIIGGHSYVKGGSGHLSKVMQNEIEQHNGKVYLLSEIVKIRSEKNKITSIIDKKGNEFTADYFVMACDPNNIFKLLDNPISDPYIEKLNDLEKSCSITQLFLGLNRSPEELGIKYSNIYFQRTSLEDSYNQSYLGNVDKTNYNIAFYGLLDPTLNKEGTSSIHITSIDYIHNWPERGTEEYKRKKEQVTEILLDNLIKIIPSIKKEYIQVMELATPRTMQRYTNNSNGSIYGFAQNIKQGGLNRISFRTPFDNTILVGAWSFPGGGYEGAIISGSIGADKLLNMINSKNSNNGGEFEMLSINELMNGFIKKFNPKNAEGLHIVYKFIFEGYNPIYLEVKDQTAKLIDPVEKVDTTLKMTHETWHKLAFNEISGQDALMDGLVVCEGNLRNFASIPKIFDK